MMLNSLDTHFSIFYIMRLEKYFIIILYRPCNILMKLQDAGKLKVIVRFRPLNQRELQMGAITCIQSLESNTIKLKQSPNLPKIMNTRFSFDKIFDQSSTQKDVHNVIGKNIINSIFQGINGSIITYGQTSSGKSYTCLGSNIRCEEQKGLIPRIIEDIFYQIRLSPSCIQYRLKLSIVEIYMQKLRDLLEINKNDLRIRESKTKGIYIENVSQRYISNKQELIQLLKAANNHRLVEQTQNNEISSRSHMIFILTLSQTNLRDMSAKSATLMVVDLAGSQKINKQTNEGKVIEEAKKINKSLSALGNVIYALTENNITHVPYRDSKLTRILQESLGGNAKTILIINCNPNLQNEWQTINSLRFGYRAKNIRNKPRINKQYTVTELLLLLEKSEKKTREQQRLIKELRLSGASSLKIIEINTFGQTSDQLLSPRSEVNMKQLTKSLKSDQSKRSLQDFEIREEDELNFEKLNIKEWELEKQMLQSKIEKLTNNIESLNYEKVVMKREQEILKQKHEKTKILYQDLKQKVALLQSENRRIVEQALKLQIQSKQYQQNCKEMEQKIKLYQVGIQKMLNEAEIMKTQTEKFNTFIQNPEKIQYTYSIIKSVGQQSQSLFRKSHKSTSMISMNQSDHGKFQGLDSVIQSFKKQQHDERSLTKNTSIYQQKSYQQDLLQKKTKEINDLTEKILIIQNQKKILENALNMQQNKKIKRILTLESYLVELSACFYMLRCQQHTWQTHQNINDNQHKRKNQRIFQLEQELSKSKDNLYKLKLKYEELAISKYKQGDISEFDFLEHLPQKMYVQHEPNIVKILKSSCKKLSEFIQ